MNGLTALIRGLALPQVTVTTHSDPPSGDASRPEPLDAWTDDVGDAFDEANDARVDLFVRSMSPPVGASTGQETAIERLQALVDASVIDDFTVSVWGERICLCDTCTSTDAVAYMLEKIRDLERWGEEYDASVREFFEERSQSSSIVDEERETLTPPRITAALYLDGSIAGAFPCRMGGRTCSVSDFFATVESMSGDHALATGEANSGPAVSTR